MHIVPGVQREINIISLIMMPANCEENIFFIATTFFIAIAAIRSRLQERTVIMLDDYWAMKLYVQVHDRDIQNANHVECVHSLVGLGIENNSL